MSNFAGLRVLALESRRAEEIGKLISSRGGAPVVAPSMREVPLESNKEALAFASDLRNGRFPVVIFLTGVGARALARVVQSVYPLEQFIAALKKSAVVARGPKPAAVLREWGVPIAISVPEPNTWRELLRSLDEHAESAPVQGRRVALQEYGAPNPELLAGLAERGAIVTRVPVYQWALPENIGPLRDAVAALAREEIDVVLFTTSIQIEHLLRVAGEMGLAERVRQALRKAVLASIGPTTSEALREHGLAPDLEPSHPKLGFLVTEAAERSSALLAAKRGRQPAP